MAARETFPVARGIADKTIGFLPVESMEEGVNLDAGIPRYDWIV